MHACKQAAAAFSEECLDPIYCVRLFPPAQHPQWGAGMRVTFGTKSRHTGHGHVAAAPTGDLLSIMSHEGRIKSVKKTRVTQVRMRVALRQMRAECMHA